MDGAIKITDYSFGNVLNNFIGIYPKEYGSLNKGSVVYSRDFFDYWNFTMPLNIIFRYNQLMDTAVVIEALGDMLIVVGYRESTRFLTASIIDKSKLTKEGKLFSMKTVSSFRSMEDLFMYFDNFEVLTVNRNL